MSIKLVILETGEQLVADVKELFKGDRIQGYILHKPFAVSASRPMFIEEGEDEDKTSVEITMSSWILLSKDEEVLLPPRSVLTVVNPVDDVVKLYEERKNG